MPKSYSERERMEIIAVLREAAFESMLKQGVKKTTVDDLVKKVRIPKGTFYLFYKSKELLLYDAIMQVQEKMHVEMSVKLQKLSHGFDAESLTDLLFDFFEMGFSIGILQLMHSGEMEVLIRKLPDEIVAEHIQEDDDFLVVLQGLFPGMSTEEVKVYSAAFRGLFFTAAYKREIGEELYDEALKLLIKGLVLQMCSERKEGRND
ncbi:MAG: TetR/AcrR family transcriptional regulator [Lachnospiraceae bacterium]|nr:TetR/AcrR family transcriptional regulator [Lachnospiraceae bacterium]